MFRYCTYLSISNFINLCSTGTYISFSFVQEEASVYVYLVWLLGDYAFATVGLKCVNNELFVWKFVLCTTVEVLVSIGNIKICLVHCAFTVCSDVRRNFSGGGRSDPASSPPLPPGGLRDQKFSWTTSSSIRYLPYLCLFSSFKVTTGSVTVI